MFKRTRGLAVLTILVLSMALVLEPLSVKDSGSGSRPFSWGASSLRRAFSAAASGVVHFVGDLFGVDEASAASGPRRPPEPDQTPVEVTSLRSRDVKVFRRLDGTRYAVFQANQHYEAAPGRWEDVDLGFRSDGDGFTMDRASVIVHVSDSYVEVKDRATAKGIRYPTGSAPTVSGRKATFSGNGLTWSYTTLAGGIKLSATVSTRLGARSFMFPHQLIGNARALTVNPSGDLVSDAFVIPRGIVVGADGVEYSVGAWRVQGQNLVFDFDDTSLPDAALPYDLDPTTNFSIGTSNDDAILSRSGPTYPPLGSFAINHSTTFVGACREKISTTFRICNALVRWNTSSLPDNAVILGATLEVYPVLKGDANNRALTADWYPWTPLATSSDYAETAATSASGASGWDITAFTVNSTNQRALVNYTSNISKTGYTGLRLHVSGLIPTGQNRVDIASYEVANPHAKLIIDYNTLPATPTALSPTTAGLVTTTPSLNVSATDPDNDPLDIQYQVSEFSNLSPVLIDSGWQSRITSWPVPAGKLSDDKTYYWRARAKDAYQTTGWSSTQSFTVDVSKIGSRGYWPMWSMGPLSVNQATGNMLFSVPGPSYATAVGSMGFSATYNSLATGDEGLGAGWNPNAGEELATPPSRLIDHNASGIPANERYDAVEVILPEGDSAFYWHIPNSLKYQAEPGDTSELKKNAELASPTWTLSHDDGTIYSFSTSDSQGVANLQSAEIIDSSPGQGTLAYSFSGAPVPRLRTVTLTAGGTGYQQLQFAYGAESAQQCPAIQCITGLDGVQWKYVAEGDAVTGRLAKVIRGSREVMRITYETGGAFRPVKIQNANDLNKSDPNISPSYNAAHAMTFTYDGSGRIATINEGPVTGRTPSTATWNFNYFPSSVAASATRAAHGGDPAGTARTAAGYTTVTPPNQQGQPSPKSTRAYYDEWGRTLETRDVFGNPALVAYNDEDQLIWQESWFEDGGVAPSDYSYDAATKLLMSVTGPDPDGASGVLGRPVTEYRYDETKIGTSQAAGPTISGLQASYYENRDMQGRAKLRRNDSSIEVGIGPPSGVNATSGWSARWTGTLQIDNPGSYRFINWVEGGMRMLIDGAFVVDDWDARDLHNADSLPISLAVGSHELTVEFYTINTGGEMVMNWQCDACSPQIPFGVVPSSALRPGWLNRTSVKDPNGILSFNHVADPASGRADYDLIKVELTRFGGHSDAGFPAEGSPLWRGRGIRPSFGLKLWS